MHNYPLRVVEAMIASGQSLKAIEDFIENSTHLSEEARAALWLFAWTETNRENRPHRVGELIEGERQLAGQVTPTVAVVDLAQRGWLTCNP